MANNNTMENKKKSIRTRKPAEKKIETEIIKNDNDSKDNKTKKKIKVKRDKTYTFYCTEAELQELERRAEKKYLTLAEYFRIKVFADD